MANLKPVDLILCHNQDGSVQPLRLRVMDEDGQYQAFTIKEYRDLSHHGARTMPDGVSVTDKTLIFECQIIVWDRKRLVRLYSNEPYLKWYMASE